MDYTKLSSRGFTASARVDFELRSYMLSVYQHMSLALLFSGLVALLVSSSPTLTGLLFGTPLAIVVMFAPLGVAIYMGSRFYKMSLQSVRNTFWLYSGLMGLSLSSIFLSYSGVDIATTFFITASTFGAMCLYGYTTKKDLSGIGNFLIMGLIGMIIAGVVNIFLRSNGLEFIVSFVGIIIFTGLTAYDTQRIKDLYYSVDDQGETKSKLAIYGSFMLYMDFINLFLSMLRFMKMISNDRE